MLRVSYSDLKMYLSCGRMKWFKDNPVVPRYVDYPRLGGIAVHDHVKFLHKSNKEGRSFFYRTKRAALNAFWFRWRQMLDTAKARGSLINPNPDDEHKFGLVGMTSLAHYWDATVNISSPLEVERRYTFMYEPEVKLIGIFDQVRLVELNYIEKHRPELVKDGVLSSEYDPVIILDLKTEYPSYDPSDGITPASDREWIRTQFELHEYLQPSFYTLLYKMKHGKWPVGFVWYHMRTNRGFFTYREERDLVELRAAITHFVDNHNAASFPKNVGKGCRKCDYFMICHGDRPFLRSYPEQLLTLEGNGPSYIAPPVVEEEKQLRLKMKVGRRSRKAPTIVDRNPEVVVLRELPIQTEISDLD